MSEYLETKKSEEVEDLKRKIKRFLSDEIQTYDITSMKIEENTLSLVLQKGMYLSSQTIEMFFYINTFVEWTKSMKNAQSIEERTN